VTWDVIHKDLRVFEDLPGYDFDPYWLEFLAGTD